MLLNVVLVILCKINLIQTNILTLHKRSFMMWIPKMLIRKLKRMKKKHNMKRGDKKIDEDRLEMGLQDLGPYKMAHDNTFERGSRSIVSFSFDKRDPTNMRQEFSLLKKSSRAPSNCFVLLEF